MLYSATQRLYNLIDEEKVDDKTLFTERSTKLRRAATKRKKSKLLEANLTQKKIKSEVDPSTLPPPLPVPSKSEEFWTWIGEHSRLIPESTQSFLTEIIQRPTERELFEKPEKARFSKPRDSGVLSSKLNSIKIKEKTEYDPKMGQLVEERLAKGIMTKYLQTN